MAGQTQPRSARFVGLVGDPKFFDGDETTDPGNPVSVISETVPAGKVWQLSQFLGSCSLDGEFEVEIGITNVGGGETGSGVINLYFPWFPGRPMTAGQTVTVTFTQSADVTCTTNVRGHLQLTEDDA